jgi:hypothetical protein
MKIIIKTFNPLLGLTIQGNKTVMLKNILLIFLFTLLFNSNVILPQNNSSDIKQSLEFFGEAKNLSELDNGNLWGIKLYGPMLFVNPATRFIIANEPDNENYLEKKGEAYCGTLPKEVNIANTSLDWKGKKWTMVILPLPSNKLERTSLMMHELFHRIQGKLNLLQFNTPCNHLDQKDARILLRLEWQELVLAFKTEKQERLIHIKNALTLNKYRKALYSGADTLESQMELNEGLAEYTGLKLSREPVDTIINFEAQKINMADIIPSFVRSFAYISGPLYCFLLDESGVQWRNKITSKTKLTDLLTNAYAIKLSNDSLKEVHELKGYDKYFGIVKFENERELKRQEQITRLKDKFINKPVIIIHLQNMNIQFDPRNLIPIENIGTVYPNLRITDNWGILNVTNEALLSSDWQSIWISLPDNFIDQMISGNIKSPDWVLELKKGWSLKPAERKGSYILSKID